MSEPDWANLDGANVAGGTFLPETQIEILRDVAATDAKAVIFDFDGTLSCIRSGWVEVMVPLMVAILLDLKTGESPEELEQLVREFVARLTGKQTIYQMIELAEQVKKRGGTPLDPIEYKHHYLDRLWEQIKDRVAGLESGRIAPDEMLVPGSRALLEALRDRGLCIFIASGTDEQFVAREAELLDVTRYVEGKVYGAIDDFRNYSKRQVIQRIIAEHAIGETPLLGFGDGYVEIEDVKATGGVAVGVATDEPVCRAVDEWKRKRLILAGADVIIPNYRELDALMACLF